VVHGEASLDARAQTGQGSTTLRVYEARGSASASLARQWEFYTDAGVREGEGFVDESYVEYGSGETRLRLGRFFLPVGIQTRSELYYTGFVQIPFVKYYPINGYSPFRSEQGITVAGGSPRFRYEAGLLGGDGAPGLLGLHDPQDATLRLQGYSGRLVLGVNGYAGTTRTPTPGGDASDRAVRLAGLDWRYSTPGWIVRGEWWTGRTAGRALDGGYVDLLYHPTALPAWTFVLRGEVVHWRHTFHRVTIGARYIPAPGWALHLNWIDENRDYGAKGLHLQVLRTVEF
jgi:hypothetical protein